MLIQVCDASGHSVQVDSVDLDDTVLLLKRRIEALTTHPAHLQRLLLRGRELSDTDTLEVCSVFDGAIIQMAIRHDRPDDPDDEAVVDIPEDAASRFARTNQAQADEQAMLAISYAKTVALFVVVDAAVVIFAIMTLGIMNVFVLLVAVAAPSLGYLGAKYMRIGLLVFYVLYLIANISVRVLLVTKSSSAFEIAFGVIGLVMEVVILATVLKFMLVIRQQSAADLFLLRRQLHPCQLRLR